jgi:chromosome segregation ATPase
LREELIRTLAIADPSASERRLRFLFSRAGDVGRQGFANLSLGIQQAAFAFEDFFSVTGGLDQRIRAAGNNISQLGFVLGGTTGLITGISVAIGAQLVASIIKWTGVTEDAEKRQRELKDALSSTNSALERQRQLAEQLRDVYRDLAKSIAEVGEPERFRNERQQREQIAAVQRQQEERRRAAIEANSPQIAQQRGRIAEIDRQLETEQNAATRRRLIERRNAADRAARREIDDIERRGAENFGPLVQARGGIEGARRALTARGGPRETVQRDINAAARRGNEAEVSRLARELAVIENTIQRLADASVTLGAERGQGLIGGLNRGLERAQGIEGVSQIEAASSLVRGEFERLQNELSDGTLSFDRFNVELQKAQAVGTILEQASEQARAFFDALQSAATELARAVEQEASGRAVSQRRAANAAEAEFGPNDPRAQVARRQQEQSEAEARRTEQERQRIDAESQRIIRQFEGQTRAGRGDPQAAALATRIQEIEASLANAPRTPVEADAQDRLRPELEDNRRRLRQLAEATPDVQRLRQQADANDVRNQGFNQNQDAVRRGMEAAITPAQQAAETLRKTFSDLRAALAAGAISLEAFNDATKRTVEEQVRSVAPAIAALGDAVQNAVLQGPSRAALNAQDVSTPDGARELSRLLRGEDPARDANLVELQKQSELLKGILEEAKANGRVPIVDMK